MRQQTLSAALAAAAIALNAGGCGRGDDHINRGPGAAAKPAAEVLGPPLAAPPATTVDVRSCKVSAATTALALAGAVSYAGDLYPIMQKNCASCHNGAQENRQDSTNCFYMRDHI